MPDIRLLTPAKIGPVEFKNRIIVSSMCLYFSGKNGEVTEKQIAFFENRAKAGTGAFIIPANPHGDNKRARGSLTDDSRIAQWKPLIDRLHAQGAKAICQIHPSGIQFGRVGYAKSPFDLTTEELRELIESYAYDIGHTSSYGIWAGCLGLGRSARWGLTLCLHGGNVLRY